MENGGQYDNGRFKPDYFKGAQSMVRLKIFGFLQMCFVSVIEAYKQRMFVTVEYDASASD